MDIVCDSTGEPLAGMLRPGSAGSNTAADHLAVLDAAITALPPGFRRQLMVTADGAGASHDLITRLDKLAARPGCQLTYSVGWELGARERAAIAAVPAAAVASGAHLRHIRAIICPPRRPPAERYSRRHRNVPGHRWQRASSGRGDMPGTV